MVVISWLVIGFNGWSICDGDSHRRGHHAPDEHRELIFQGQTVAPAIRRAGDGKINDASALGWDRAVRITDGLWIKPVAGAHREAVGLINQGCVRCIGDGDTKNERVFGIEPECLLNPDLIIVEVADQRFGVIGDKTDIGDAFRLLCLEQRKGFGLVEQRKQF